MCKFLHKFKRKNEGAVAIEFAILAIPFLMVLFSIIEASMLFFFSSTTERALAEVSRKIKTGEFQETGGKAPDFKKALCKKMAFMGGTDCASSVRVDVVSTPTGQFKNLKLPSFPAKCSGTPEQIKVCKAKPPDPSKVNSKWSTTNGGDVVIVRVQYVYKLLIPAAINRLANAGGNTHVITKTTAFRNEPFNH
ncbi:MAG: TadE/TadG family type IV pilus assembly protein [Robiginitomaculum sp.]